MSETQKTYPELIEAIDVQDGDLIATYRGVGPLKRIVASVLKDYIVADKADKDGGNLTGDEPDDFRTAISALKIDGTNADGTLLTNLNVYTKGQVDGLIDGLTIDIDNAVDAAEAFALQAETARDAAEAARDAAQLSAGIFADTAAGLAGTIEGDYFTVVSSDDEEFLILYLHEAGPVATEINVYPAVGALLERPKVEESPTNQIVLEDDSGLGAVFTTDIFRDTEGAITAGVDFSINLVTDNGHQDIIITDNETGLGAVISGESPDVAEESEDIAGPLFSATEYAYVEDRANTEVLRLNTQDVSVYQASVNGANLRIGTGQSFMAASDNARLFLSASRIALMGLGDRPCWSVGPESRCVNSGATYVPFNSGDLTLTPLRENFIGPTNSDIIYSDADVRIGDYPNNARGGTPETVRDILIWVLRNRWNLRADTAVQTEYSVAMNHAKTDGSIAELSTGDGLARMLSLIEVFGDAIDTNEGSAETRICDVVDINHGEADEAAGTLTYQADWETFRGEINTKLSTEIGQSTSPVYLMQQVGGARYGTAAMVCANIQVDMMLDIDSTSAGFHLVGVKYEVPHFYFVDASTGHPNPNDGHPTLAGNVLMGIRSAVGYHYIMDRGENYWVPFPYECYYSGNRFLVSIPAKFGPIREVQMVNGVELVKLDSLGITFESSGGSDNPVTFARVVEGYDYLIEGECSDDISGFTTMKTGKRTGPFSQSGFTNIRDSFTLDLPFQLPFDQQQTIYSTEFVDSPLTNGIGRYLEDIPGWVGTPDLGNPCARRTITALPMPPL